ncbi:MAG: CDP-glycerol glycerophosphotransferase family protein [Vibrio sp.]
MIYKFLNCILDLVFSFFYSSIELSSDYIVFNSTGNLNYNFNSRFLFESMLQDEHFKDKKIYFIINDDNKRAELNKKYPNCFISSNSFFGRILCLKAKVWITSTIETPVWGLSKNSKRIVYHLGHGIPLKNICLAENNISKLRWLNRKLRVRLFSHVTTYSSFFDDFFIKAFGNESIRLMHYGQPRNDTLVQNESLEKVFKLSRKEDETYVLYSPTWRPYSTTKLFPFDDFSVANLHSFLEENNIYMFIREHPYFKAEIPLGLFESDYVFNSNSDVISDITPYLNGFDILVTDYSSIYLDFLSLNKKVLYIPYDIERYERMVGFSNSYDSLIFGSKITTYKDLLNELCSTHVGNADELMRFLNVLNLKTKSNCTEHLNYIYELLNNA